MTENNLANRDEFKDENYKPFNALALIALVVAVSSVGAIFNVLMLAVSVLALLLALAALYVGRPRGDKGMSGGSLAITAVILSVFTASCGLAKKISHDAYLKRYAKEYSQVFLDELFALNFESMYEYSKDPPIRILKGQDLKQHYLRESRYEGEQYPPAMEMAVWKQIQPIKEILRDHLKGKLEMIGVGKLDRDFYHDIVGVDYRYTPASPEIPVLEFRVIMLRREYTRPLFVQWQSKTFIVLKGPKAEAKMEVFEMGQPKTKPG